MYTQPSSLQTNNPLFLRRIIIQNFRNIELQELEFSPNVNCISGNNGEGKTNLMDAVYYLSMTKSAFGASDKFNFRYTQDNFAISGTYAMPSGIESRFSISVSSDGSKVLKRDDKACQKISDHIGLLPVVMVSPSDISLVSESGEERRRFVNSVISQLDRNYLSNLQQYNRLLLQRNKLLKEGFADPSLLDTFDERLDAFAEPVSRTRREFTDSIRPVVREYYSRLSGGMEEVEIEYRTDLQKDSLKNILSVTRDRDRALKFTGSGIQRDDFVFTMNGYPIRKCGSQGQQKSFLVALKFAQYEIMKSSYGFAPVMLLDDLFDKLDMERVGHLLKMVSGNDFGQIFISDSNKVRLSSLVDSITEDRAYFVAEGGTFRKDGER